MKLCSGFTHGNSDPLQPLALKTAQSINISLISVSCVVGDGLLGLAQV